MKLGIYNSSFSLSFFISSILQHFKGYNSSNHKINTHVDNFFIIPNLSENNKH